MNNFKSIKSLVFVIVAANILTSCSATSNNELQELSLSEINASNYTDFEMQLDNLVLPEEIVLPTVDKLYTFSVMQNKFDKDVHSEENKDHIEDFCGLIYRYSSIEVESEDISIDVYEDEQGEVYDLYFQYYDEINSLEYTYCPNGTFSIRDTAVMDDVHGGNCIAYHLINDKVNLDDLKGIDGFSVGEALNLCQTQIVDKLAAVIPEDSLNVYSVSLFRTHNGSYSYYIVYRKEYLGLELSESGEFLFANSGFVKPTYLAVQINSDKEIFHVINMYANVYDENSIIEIEDGSYISLETACGLLSEYLAGYNIYKIENIDMVYFMPTRFEEDSSELVYTNYIPGYEITLQSKLADENNSANLAPRITAYISMVSGDIYVLDTINRNQYFVLE